jgi:type II restriction enzyme
MQRLSANNLVDAIGKLRRDVHYNYVNPSTKNRIKIERVEYPEGPIVISRIDFSKEGNNAKSASISSEQIWRVANALIPNTPINLDRVLGASYNTRSVLEALLAHTPEFYKCYPKRIESIGYDIKIKKGHKHQRPRSAGMGVFHYPKSGVWRQSR